MQNTSTYSSNAVRNLTTLTTLTLDQQTDTTFVNNLTIVITEENQTDYDPISITSFDFDMSYTTDVTSLILNDTTLDLGTDATQIDIGQGNLTTADEEVALKEIGLDAVFFTITVIALVILLILLSLPIRILIRLFTKIKFSDVKYKDGLNPQDSVMYVHALIKIDEDEDSSRVTTSPVDIDSSRFDIFRLYRR